jgi:shikimate kinase
LFTGKNVPIEIKKSIKEKLMNNRNALKSNLALIGFMGTGKTSVGQVLAEKGHFNFLDTDQVIEESEGSSINDIFKKKGEKKFREIEKSLMSPFLQHSKNTVLSLGGGTVLDSHTVQKLRKTCRVIWLWNPLDKILQRTNFQKRPLLSGFSRNHMEQLYLSRIPYYAEASDLVVPSPTGKIKQTAQRIKNEIDQAISH